MADVTVEIDKVQAFMRHLFEVRGSENALAGELKLPRATVSRLRGPRLKELPEPETLLAIARAFHVTVDDVLSGAVHFGRPGKAARRRYEHARQYGFPTKVDRLATLAAALSTAAIERQVEPFGLVVASESGQQALAAALKRQG